MIFAQAMGISRLENSHAEVGYHELEAGYHEGPLANVFNIGT